jgi:hypothetical protein
VGEVNCQQYFISFFHRQTYNIKVMAHHKIKKQKKSIVPHWVLNPPLLPESLRKAWSGEVLPTWVAEELTLPVGATFSALASDLKSPGTRKINPRIVEFIIDRLRKKSERIAPLCVFMQPWPPSLNPHKLPLTVRTRNCLQSAGLLEDRVALSSVTYGQLLKLPNMGIRSIVHFSCVAEAIINQTYGSISTDEPELTSKEQREAHICLIKEAVKSPWAYQISEQDPRFSDLLSAGEGTITERIEQNNGMPEYDPGLDEDLPHAIVEIKKRVNRLSSQPLDRALKNFLGEISGLRGRKLDAMIGRFGFDGNPPLTLEEAGRIIHVTRERVRQLEKKYVMDRVPQHPIFMPSLDDALELVRKKSPCDVEGIADALRKSGLTSVNFHPESLRSAAELCGRTLTFEIEKFRGRTRIATTSQSPYASRIISIANSQASASGASNIQEVAAEATERGFKVDEDSVIYLLKHFANLMFLEGDWFWNPKGKVNRNRVRNITRKILSITMPVHISVIREGLRRVFAVRGARGLSSWPLTVPPRSVLKRFYEEQSEFIVDENGNVSSAHPLDYRSELSSTEQTFVDVLRSSPACVLDRESLASGCMKLGMNLNTFSVYSSYSPVITHLGTDIWSLRGVQVDPAAVEAIREANSLRLRPRRIVDFGWAPNGNLWVAVRLPYVSSMATFVFGIPAPIKRFISGRTFPAKDYEGTNYGNIKITNEGQSFGYGKYLSQKGADEGDVLIAEFNIIENIAILRLGDDEMIEEMNPTM